MATRAKRQVEVICDPEIMGGEPTVSGTRVLAETIVVYLRNGKGVREIVSDYPYLPFGAVDVVERWARANGKL